MTVSDEELMAYVDGELDAARSESLRQEIAANADLRRRVAEQQALRERLRHAFDRTLEEPVPARLTELTVRARVVELGSSTRRRPTRVAWLSGLALAAGIVLGIALGPALVKLAREQPDVIANGANVAAGGALADALSRRLASEPSATVASTAVRLFRSTATAPWPAWPVDRAPNGVSMHFNRHPS